MSIIGEKPLLIDLSFGRVGTYIGTEKTRAGFETHTFIPLNSLFKKEYIMDVPENSLFLIPPFDKRCPGTIALLISGEHGEAPLLNNYLREKWNEVLRKIEEEKKLLQIKSAAVETQKRITERGAFGGGLSEYLKQIQAIRRSVQGEIRDDKLKPKPFSFE